MGSQMAQRDASDIGRIGFIGHERELLLSNAALHDSICAIILHMEWTVDTLNHTVDAELNALSADMRARFTRVVRLIESFGVDRVGQPHVKHLQGRLWEMRLRGRDGIARAAIPGAP